MISSTPHTALGTAYSTQTIHSGISKTTCHFRGYLPHHSPDEQLRNAAEHLARVPYLLKRMPERANKIKDNQKVYAEQVYRIALSEPVIFQQVVKEYQDKGKKELADALTACLISLA